MRWFESSYPSQVVLINFVRIKYLFDSLAQSVEHLTFNQGAMDSSSIRVTIGCPGGEIGRRVGFKIQWTNHPCRFKSGSGHHLKNHSLKREFFSFFRNLLFHYSLFLLYGGLPRGQLFFVDAFWNEAFFSAIWAEHCIIFVFGHFLAL